MAVSPWRSAFDAPPRNLLPRAYEAPPDTDLDGPLLLEPAVHGDERGFFTETFRDDAWAAAGRRRPFVQDNHSRSRAGRCAACTSSSHPVRPSSCAAPAAAFSTSSSTCGAARRRSASGRRRARRRARAPAVRPDRLRARLLRARASRRRRLQVLELLRRRDRGRIAYDDPEIGIGWPSGMEPSSPSATGRRRGWRRSRTRCPSACESRRPLRAQPDRHAAPRQPAHRAAGVAVRALGRRAASCVRMEDLDSGRVRPGVAERAARRPRRDRARLGRRGRLPVRSASSATTTRSRGCARAGRVYECFCTRAEIRDGRVGPARPAARGRLSRARACG